jgi:MscS family membrane protein
MSCAIRRAQIILLVLPATLCGLLFGCLAASGSAAEKPGTFSRAKEAMQPAGQEKTPEDPLGRSTPQGTVLGFIKAAAQGENDRALQYLDTKKTGPDTQKLVHDLQAILDRGFSGGRSAALSGKPEGNLDDNLPPNKERIGTVRTSSGSLEIFLDRIQRGTNPPIWVFSAVTLAKVPKAYREMDFTAIDSYLPKFLVNTWILWFPLWRWLIILLVIPFLFFLATVLTRLIAYLLLLYSRRHLKDQSEHPGVRLAGPIRILIFASAIWGLSLVSESIVVRNFCAYMAATLMVMGATWLSLRLIDIFSDLREQRLAAASSEKISLFQLGKRLVKVLALIIGTLFIFYIGGINLTAVIAGLGVGGIAVALAAQKTLENLFGGITVVSDQPIRVGDFCRAGEYLGTVQAVGLRSTRIRTLDRTIVAIPNGQLATMNLENFSLRDKIWFHHTLSLRYETTPDQLRYILAEIRGLLYRHPKVETSSARVRLIGFGDSSLNLEAFAYVWEKDYGNFLHIQEDLLLRIMEIVAESGSGFAFPSQTTYLAQDAGIGGEKTEKAILKVRQWREQGELPFPDFSPETIAKINDQLEYPPPDSARANKKP